LVLMVLRWAALAVATFPWFYYLGVIFAARRFFRRQDGASRDFGRGAVGLSCSVDLRSTAAVGDRRYSERDFTPPASILKPVRGLDREAYENYASFCRQDYPQYEMIFAVASGQDPAVPVIRKLIADFPHLPLRLLIVAEKHGANDKVSKLCGLAPAAQHNLLIVSDGDIRVGPDYLRWVAAPFREARVGAVTSLYTGIPAGGLWSKLEAANLSSDFMAAVLLARQAEGVRFALGATMAVRREALEKIGGFEALADIAADDHYLGRLIAAQGFQVELVDGAVKTICAPESWRAFFDRHLRWAIMGRQARPGGYLGYGFTLGLPWTLIAVLLAPTRILAFGYVAAYLVLRAGVAWTVGVQGLHDSLLKRQPWLVPLWDVFAFFFWLASNFSNRIRWHGAEFSVARDRMHPTASRGNDR
jgi:ceramide glucosyltransferase